LLMLTIALFDAVWLSLSKISLPVASLFVPASCQCWPVA
jgi:hypothetical protein